MASQSEQEITLQETLDFLQQELEENKNFKIINKYGGKGGFGLVLFVEDKADQTKKYAIKAQSIINTNTGKLNQSLLKLCKEEAEMMMKCKHKNVVEIHSEFELGFYHFIQMNLCKCSINNWIVNNSQKIPDMIFLHYVNQIIDGLEYLHSKDYVLRDLSVRNILITTEGIIQLCDFGLAKKYDEAFQSKALYSEVAKGVFLYFPPELLEDLNESKQHIKQTKQGDIWALGICLSLLGGAKITDFLHVSNPKFQIPHSQQISSKSNQLKSIRKTYNSINQKKKIYELFLENPSQDFIDAPNNQLEDNFVKQLQRNHQQIQLSEISSQSTDTTNTSKSIQSEQILNNSQIKIQRLIDFNFSESESLYQNYSEYSKIYPQNMDVIISMGFLELKYKSNFQASRKYFEQSIQINNQEIDAIHGLCMCILYAKEYKSFNQALFYLQTCYNLNSQNWRTYYLQACILYKRNQDKQVLQLLEIGLQLKNNSAELLSLKHLILKNQIQDLDFLQKIVTLNTNNDPYVYLRIGHIFKFYNYKEKDIYYYLKAYEYNSNDLVILINLTDYYKKNDEDEKSKLYLQKLQDLYPTNSYLLNYLGNIEQDEQNKMKLYLQAIQYDSSNIPAYKNLGRFLENQRKFDETIKQYERILEINIDDEEANYRIGYILGFQKLEYLKAVDYYKKSIYQNPANIDLQSEYFVLQSDIYMDLNNPIKAIELLNSIISQNPKFYKSYQKLGQIILNKKQYQQALKYFEKQIELHPSDDAFYNIGLCYKNQRNFLKAIQFYNKAIELNEKQYQYYYQLGKVYDEMVDKELEAFQNFYKAIDILENEKDSENIKLLEIKYSRSLEICKLGLKIKPKNQKFCFNIAKAYIFYKFYDCSLEYFIYSLEVNPNIQISYYYIGWIYQTQKQNSKKAIKFLRKSLELNNQHVDSYFYLGQAFIQRKYPSEAVECFQKVLEQSPDFNESSFCKNYINQNKDVQQKKYKPTKVNLGCYIF